MQNWFNEESERKYNAFVCIFFLNHYPTENDGKLGKYSTSVKTTLSFGKSALK